MGCPVPVFSRVRAWTYGPEPVTVSTPSRPASGHPMVSAYTAPPMEMSALPGPGTIP